MTLNYGGIIMTVRKILSRKQLEDWLKEFYPDENLDKLFVEELSNEDTWTFVNLKGTFIGKMKIREEEKYIVMPQVNMFF
jgi:hypothetical protein